MSDHESGFGVHNRRFPPCGRGGHFTLFDFADIHFGSSATARTDLVAAIERVAADPDAYWFGGGDWFDALFVGDKRFDMRLAKHLDPDLWAESEFDIGKFRLVCLDRLLDLFWPIAGRCLGLQVGNHEETVAARGQAALISELVMLYHRRCRDTKSPPNPWFEALGYNVVYQLKFQRQGSKAKTQVRVFATHGAGAAATVGGRVNRIESVLSWMPGCDLYLCRHFHDRLSHPRVRFDIVDGPRPFIQQAIQHVCLTPSFLRTYCPTHDTYGAKRLYPPSVLGPGVVRVWPFGDRARRDGRDFTRPRLEVVT